MLLQVYSFGNGSGVGKGTTEPRQYTPWLIESLGGEVIIDVATGDGHCLALTQRKAKAWREGGVALTQLKAKAWREGGSAIVAWIFQSLFKNHIHCMACLHPHVHI